MASLLPLIQDLLPMIMPSSVQIIRGSDVPPTPSRAQPAPGSEQSPADAAPIRLVDEEAEEGHVAGDAAVDAAADAKAVTSEAGSGAGPAHRSPGDGAAAGPRIIRRDAVVGLTDRMCATVLIAKPNSATPVHHHGEQDAIIYAVSGHGVLLTSPPDDDFLPVPGRSSRSTTSEADPTSSDGRTHHQEARRNPLAPGDFAVIPPWTEHQMVNEGGAEDGDVVWLVVRSGQAPVEVDLVDWGGDRIEDGKGR
ncbi:hypothetical protein NKR23_g3726 [Pleurostoma richardsiae]|uniref:Cupin 2 conserved barrel domain-containing protein n=1 Tax=Pleurostoma richardsiae TaxID=41990 RepID=A0AA38RYF2_9PEZI|nr:hypothetical protein NKR23_g3726 [Pleurostoma richardsiae]